MTLPALFTGCTDRKAESSGSLITKAPFVLVPGESFAWQRLGRRFSGVAPLNSIFGVAC
jgi:hypothetical protein